MKTCGKCKIEKEDSDFNKNQYWCRNCQKLYRENNKDKIISLNKKYRENNKDEINKTNKEYRNKNKDKIRTQQEKYRKNNKNYYTAYSKYYYSNNKKNITEYKRKYNKIYFKKNRLRINDRVLSRSKIDPIYKLRKYISNTISSSLKRRKSSKRGNSCLFFLNYSLFKLKEYLESKFEFWMNWNNRGVYDPKTWDDNDPTTWKWNIDHIIPQSFLPYTNMKDNNFKKCWALENLRPYSAKQNIIDGNRRENILKRDICSDEEIELNQSQIDGDKVKTG